MPDWTRTCFVVSPIGQRGTENFAVFRDVLESFIRPAVERSSLRLQVVRADEIHRPGSFIRDVVEYVAHSHTVIVDLTGQNANVFYELGVRHALSPRTILIARSETDIPADLREYRTLIYGDQGSGDADLQQTLARYFDEIQRTPDYPDNPVLSWLKVPQIPDDLRRTFSARLADVGGRQAEILRFILNHTRRAGQQVTQSQINAHARRDASEIYYRLEQLRLLGFIVKARDSADDDFRYQLSPEYRRELGLPDETPLPQLRLLSAKSTQMPFGSGADAPLAHFFYLRAANASDEPLKNVRVVLKRIRRFARDGSTLDDYTTLMPLKWRYGSDRERRLATRLDPRTAIPVSFGFLIKGYGFFQLDIASDPWPAGFPARLDPAQRMQVDVVTEAEDLVDVRPVSLEIKWDGEWRDDPAEMQEHLSVSEIVAN